MWWWAKISRIALLSPMYVNLRTANTVVGLTVGKKWKNIAIKELLDKCERGNKIAPLWHMCQAKQGMHAVEVQFYCPSSNYPAIISLILYFIA